MELVLRYPPTPENAAQFSELAVLAARRVSGVDLDYSSESLILLDRIVGDFSGQVELDQIAETLFCFGCYLGEVLARELGGNWVLTERSPIKDYSRWPLALQLDSGYTWNPIGKVFKRFELGEGENLHEFFQSVSSRH